MSAEQLVRYVSDAAFILIFVVMLLRAVRQPRRAALDGALFFATLATAIIVGLVGELIAPREFPPLVTRTQAAMAMLLPYLLFRLVEDFTPVPRSVRILAVGGLVASIVGVYAVPTPYPDWFTLALIVYFVVLQGYNTWRFVRVGGTTAGVTRERMRAAAAGSGFLALILLFAGLRIALPDLGGVWQSLSSASALGCGAAYFLAFAPPAGIRRYWQAPALRTFLTTTVGMPPQTALAEVAAAVEEAAAAAVGAPRAALLLWDEGECRLYAPSQGAEPDAAANPQTTIAMHVFAAQAPMGVDDATRADPENAEVYRSFGATAIVAAPITTGETRYGVLLAYADRASIFADDDLVLLALLAEELAGFLQRRALVESAAAMHAREEATRLKDEFLSAAAHDLRTPLTVVNAQAQLLQRHLRGREAPADDLAGIDRLVAESQRMRRLTDDILDASRMEAQSFVGELTPTDLVALAQDVASNAESAGHVVRVEGCDVTAAVDAERMRQVVQNLVDNAVKFSPEGGEVVIALEAGPDEVRMTVRDEGIGIPARDLPHLFDRFYRGSQVGERGFTGMGIGLFVCKRIVEEHGGRIWAESTPGRGSQFHVALSARPQ